MVFAVWHLPIRRPTLLLNNSLADAFWFAAGAAASAFSRPDRVETAVRGGGRIRYRPHSKP